MSVDFALVMDILPEQMNKGKDIAVWHQVRVDNISTPYTLPQHHTDKAEGRDLPCPYDVAEGLGS